MKFQARPANQFVLEGLEPRVLLSAGPASLALVAAAAATPHADASSAVSVAEEAVLPTSFPTASEAPATGLAYSPAEQVEDIFAGVGSNSDSFQAASETRAVDRVRHVDH